jgi:hypothetical protein
MNSASGFLRAFGKLRLCLRYFVLCSVLRHSPFDKPKSRARVQRQFFDIGGMKNARGFAALCERTQFHFGCRTRSKRLPPDRAMRPYGRVVQIASNQFNSI